MNNEMKWREEWLTKAVHMLDDVFFKPRGKTLPKFRAACSQTKYSTGKAIGQCWDKCCSADGTHEIFICPSQDEEMRVLDITLHEAIHAVVGIEEGHKGEFRKLAKDIGLEGKMTATYVSEGTPLWHQLKEIADVLGPYPHKALTPIKKKKTQQERLVYVSTENDEFRVTIKTPIVEEFGVPKDPWGNDMEPLNG